MPTSISEQRGQVLCLGTGQVAIALAAHVWPLGWGVSGTTRSEPKAAVLAAHGIEPILLGDRTSALPCSRDHRSVLLISIAPDDDGDAGLRLAEEWAAAGFRPDLTLYLSATSVYGNHDGAWVDETTVPAPSGARGRRRLEAEEAWTAFGRECGTPVLIFRLAGIYGPQSNALLTMRSGRAQRVVKPGLAFSRIHVEDIAQALGAALTVPAPATVYNLADDEPAAPDAVIAYAAELLGLPIPPAVGIEEADLSPMGRSFYADNKRVSNRRMKADLGVKLRYPTYREGLRALLSA